MKASTIHNRMNLHVGYRSNRVGLVLTLSIFFLSSPSATEAQVGLSLPPVRTPFSPLDNPQKDDAFQQKGFSPSAVVLPPAVQHKTEMDSTGKNITITNHKLTGQALLVWRILREPKITSHLLVLVPL